MSDYIVSARKYRPQTFDTVVGQEHITTTLKNAIKHQHLAHAYLFCGPRGVGKTTCARILAKTINCENPTADIEACGVCPTCISFQNNTSFNVFELDAASNNSVDDIRELINQVRFAPQQGKYKIYIIDEVHMLSAAAFNAFLKTLEEPPPYAIFILATTEKHKILPTILSRCQIFDFKRITTNDIVSHLQSIATKESMVAQEAALHIIAQKSEGAMRDALSMLDRIASFTNGMLTYSNTMEHLNLLDADFYFRITDSMLGQDVPGTLIMLDAALERGFEGDVIINGLAEHMRNLLLCKDMRMSKLLDVPTDHRPIYQEKANQSPPGFILSSLNVINDCELQYKNATNKRLHVEMCVIRLCYVLQATQGGGGQLNAEGNVGNTDVKKNSNSVGAPARQSQSKEGPIAAPIASTENTQIVDYKQNTEYITAVEETVIVTQKTEPVVAERVVQNPQPAPPKPQSAPTVSQPSTPPPAGRRLSSNIMGDLEAAMNNADLNKVQEYKELTGEMAVELFDRYTKNLLAGGKASVYAQLMQMKIEVLPPDEVHIVSPSQITDMYAKEMRTSILDYYRAETGMLIRITTEIKEDQEIMKKQGSQVLSKSEMFEAMAMKNPFLGQLKDGLGMQIEY